MHKCCHKMLAQTPPSLVTSYHKKWDFITKYLPQNLPFVTSVRPMMNFSDEFLGFCLEGSSSLFTEKLFPFLFCWCNITVVLICVHRTMMRKLRCQENWYLQNDNIFDVLIQNSWQFFVVVNYNDTVEMQFLIRIFCVTVLVKIEVVLWKL